MGVKEVRAAAILALPSLAAAALVAYLTANSMGVWMDSVEYIWAARSFADSPWVRELGSNRPVAHFPPMLPLFLSFGERLNISSLIAARWLNIVCFAISIFLVGLIVRRATGKTCAALLASIFVFACEDVFRSHAAVSSEPLFYLFTLVSLLYLVTYIQQPTLKSLIACALSVSLAALTRYAGIALLPAALIAILFLSRQPLRRAIVHSIDLTIIALLPSVIIAVRSAHVVGSATGRVFAAHSIPIWKYKQALEVFKRWFVPELFQRPRRVILSVVAVAAILLIVKLARRRSPNTRILGAIMAFIVCYAMILFLTLTFFDAATQLNARILSPMYIGFVLAAAIAVVEFLPHRAPSKVATISLVVLLLVVRICGTQRWLRINRDIDKCYAIAPWHDNPVFQFTRENVSGKKIITNDATAVYFLADCPAFELPVKFSVYSTRQNPDYFRAMSRLGEDLRSGSTVIVFFNSVGYRSDLPTVQELEKTFGLQRVYDGADALKAIVLKSKSP